ncbi:hypothetical protein IWW39_003476 [Coemansia spiralis]|uniref:F-box domain-containing protein n=1 Tax=Coemansia spiralis TaxID=417178 RepID=A0A9W8GLG6_9FUNG|nr:hypothetical protein IWW39_003476 [Coemansia spiralis]
MLPVFRLSDTLILKIILYAANAHATTLEEWKASLPYAAVCRQWRLQIIDMVYSTAILEYRKTCQRWIKKVVAPSKKWPKYEWDTNVELIASTSNGQRMTDLHVRLPQHEHDIMYIHDVVRSLGLGSVFWSGIRTLHISNCAGGECKGSHATTRSLIHKNRQESILDFFDKYMPRVGNLNLPAVYKDSDDVVSLYGKLIDLYAYQLWSVSNLNPTAFAVSAFSDNLTSLTIRLISSKPFWFPQLNISTIRYLRLMDVPHDFAWARLIFGGSSDKSSNEDDENEDEDEDDEDDDDDDEEEGSESNEENNSGEENNGDEANNSEDESDSGESGDEDEGEEDSDDESDNNDNGEYCEFSNLTDLCIEFSESYEFFGSSSKPGDKTRFELGFPNLKTLTMLDIPDSSQILASCHDLPTVSEISIGGAFAGLKKLGNLCYGESIDKVSIDFGWLYHSDMPDFYSVTNDLFGSFIIADEMRLTLSGFGYPIDPREVEWFNLTHLAFGQQVAFSTVVQLLPMLPNVTTLDIGWLEIDMAPSIEPVSLFTGASNERICQLDSRVRKLSIYTNEEPNAKLFMLDPVLYLAICMPVLENLCIPIKHVPEVQNELAYLAPHYAHLASINVKSTSK